MRFYVFILLAINILSWKLSTAVEVTTNEQTIPPIQGDGDSVDEFVGDSVGESVGDSVGESVGDSVDESVGDSVDEAVDYTGWKVFKVEGFEPSATDNRQDSSGDSKPSVDHPLIELEENPNVRVLQEHRQDGYFHITVAGKAIEEIRESLKKRGLTMEDMNVDLAGLIASTATLRSTTKSGEVTFHEYMKYSEIESFLKKFARTNSDKVRLTSIGRSTENRIIHMLVITSPNINRKSRAFDESRKKIERDSETDIVYWSDIKIEQIENSKPLLHTFLNKIVKDVPFDAYDENQTETIINTYGALKEIINHERELPHPHHENSIGRSGLAKITYEVLQKIITTIDDSKYKPNNFVNNVRRLGRSLNNVQSMVSIEQNKANSRHLTIPVSTILPQDYAKNDSIVEAIKESILILSQEFTNSSKASQDELNRLVETIGKITLIDDIKKDQSSAKKQLLIILENIAEFIKIVVGNNKLKLGTRSSSKKPAILIDGGIHAREWISPAFLMYTLTELVKDDTLTRDAEWYLIPVLNPDGYVYSWETDRLWRKNRSKNDGRRCKGVDLNRNFGYKFGGSGTSSNRCSQVYKGTGPFSEPESKALRKIVTELKPRLKAYVSVHSYGNLILHSWAYSAEDHARTYELGKMGRGISDAIKAVNGNSFTVGSTAGVLYSAAGISDDYVMNEGIPYSYTFELRDSGRYGFVLPASQIIPGVQEAYAGIKYLGKKIIAEFWTGSTASLATSLSSVAYSSSKSPRLPLVKNPHNLNSFTPGTPGAPFLYPLHPHTINNGQQQRANVLLSNANTFGNVQLRPSNHHQFNPNGYQLNPNGYQFTPDFNIHSNVNQHPHQYNTNLPLRGTFYSQYPNFQPIQRSPITHHTRNSEYQNSGIFQQAPVENYDQISYDYDFGSDYFDHHNEPLIPLSAPEYQSIPFNSPMFIKTVPSHVEHG